MATKLDEIFEIPMLHNGYVGAGVGRVSLYKGKECVKKNIPEADAVEELLRVIEASECK